MQRGVVSLISVETTLASRADSLLQTQQSLQMIPELGGHSTPSPNSPDNPALQEHSLALSEQIRGITSVIRRPNETEPKPLYEHIAGDFIEFYSTESVAMLLGVTGISAVTANSSLDRNIQNDFQDNLRNSATDGVAAVSEKLGRGYYVLPILAGSWLVGPYISSEKGAAVSEWGERSLRAGLVGGPSILTMQLITGGSRPGESPSGSHWEPLQDVNGVSGHSFIGALPFLSLAKMTDHRGVKAGLIGASALTALSRVNDNKHFLSQALLGWSIAWLATEAVDRSATNEPDRYRLFPYFISDGVGLGFDLKY